MATGMVSIPAKTWVEVSLVSVNFQIPEDTGAWAIESVAMPTSLSIRKKIMPGRMYNFDKLDGNLYMYSDTALEVAVEPIA